MTKFKRVLEELKAVLIALRNFELIYASNSDHNFARAGTEFWRYFARYRHQTGPSYDQDLYATGPR